MALPLSLNPRGGRAPQGGARLSNKDRRASERLEKQIAALEEEQRALHAQMENPAFWNGPQQAIATAQARLAVVPDELAAAYARWSALHG